LLLLILLGLTSCGFDVPDVVSVGAESGDQEG